MSNTNPWLGADWSTFILRNNNNQKDVVGIYVGFDHADKPPPAWRVQFRYAFAFVPADPSDTTLKMIGNVSFEALDIHSFEISASTKNDRMDIGRAEGIQLLDLFEDSTLSKLSKYVHPHKLMDGSVIYTLRIRTFLFLSSASRSCISHWDSKKYTGMVGIENLGATCYLNALLQMLFHVNKFRAAVYALPHCDEVYGSSTTLALQHVFKELQCSSKTVTTSELCTSFGWTSADAFTQQDVQEMMRILLDKLESKMTNTSVDGVIKGLFAGTIRSYIQCINVEYASNREEEFYDIQLDVKGCADIYQSFDKYISTEVLDGENQYDAGANFGKQDAKKGVIFTKFPPVLTIHLKRFDFDLYRMCFTKIHDTFKFPLKLHLDKYLSTDSRSAGDEPVDVNSSSGSGSDSKHVYILHSVLVHAGDVGGGHYYAYIRPSMGFDYENLPSFYQQHVEVAGGDCSDNGIDADDGCSYGWYKFNDEHVIKVRKSEALEQTFGFSKGSDTYSVGVGSAYMLVYIRAAEAADVMFNINDSHIPVDLVQRLKVEQTKKNTLHLKALRSKSCCRIRYFFENDIKYSAFVDGQSDLIHLSQPYMKHMMVSSDSTILYLTVCISKMINIEPSRIRLWHVSITGDIRITKAARLDDLCSETTKDVTSYYVELLPFVVDAISEDTLADVRTRYMSLIVAESVVFQAITSHLNLDITTGSDSFDSDDDSNALQGCGIGSGNRMLVSLMGQIECNSHIYRLKDLTTEMFSLLDEWNDLTGNTLHENEKLVMIKVYDPHNELPELLYQPVVPIPSSVAPNDENGSSRDCKYMKYVGSVLVKENSDSSAMHTEIVRLISTMLERGVDSDCKWDTNHLLYYRLRGCKLYPFNYLNSEGHVYSIDSSLNHELIVIDKSLSANDDLFPPFGVSSLQSYIEYICSRSAYKYMPYNHIDMKIALSCIDSLQCSSTGGDDHSEDLSEELMDVDFNNNQSGNKRKVPLAAAVSTIATTDIVPTDTSTTAAVPDTNEDAAKDDESDKAVVVTKIPLNASVPNLFSVLSNSINIDKHHLMLYITRASHTPGDNAVPCVIDGSTYDKTLEILLSKRRSQIRDGPHSFYYSITPFRLTCLSDDGVNVIDHRQSNKFMEVVLVDARLRAYRHRYVSDHLVQHHDLLMVNASARCSTPSKKHKIDRLPNNAATANVASTTLSTASATATGSDSYPTDGEVIPQEFVEDGIVYLSADRSKSIHDLIPHLRSSIGLPTHLHNTPDLVPVTVADMIGTEDITDLSGYVAVEVPLDKLQIYRNGLLSESDRVIDGASKQEKVLGNVYPLVIFTIDEHRLLKRVFNYNDYVDTLPNQWIEGTVSKMMSKQLCVQHVSNSDILLMSGNFHGCKSICVHVFSFTLYGNTVDIMQPAVQSHFLCYVREDDDYNSLCDRLGDLTGEATEMRKNKLAVVFDRLPHFIPKESSTATNNATATATAVTPYKMLVEKFNKFDTSQSLIKKCDPVRTSINCNQQVPMIGIQRSSGKTGSTTGIGARVKVSHSIKISG